jgi:hypothetical protein
LHGHARRWLVNEKGAIASTAALTSAPAQFEQRVTSAFAHLSHGPDSLTQACDRLQAVVDDAVAVVAS